MSYRISGSSFTASSHSTPRLRSPPGSSPGEREEVDYAGDPIEWLELATGAMCKAFVFVSALGFSQLLFAWAAEDMKGRNRPACHRRMFAAYGGVAHVTIIVPEGRRFEVPHYDRI